jgi:predicted transcriptional regulator
MAQKPAQMELTKRENQIMAALYRNGSSSIAEIAAAIPNSPSDTALRTLLRILEDKGFVSSNKDQRKNIYTPTVSRREAAMPALQHVLETFFGGSLSGAVAAHLADPEQQISEEEQQRLIRLIDESQQGKSDD